ncbi:MAG: putative molybdenum carrier protein [Aphanocapsa lilacina HA4352-LM1]|nr:putative molybdenum carrier protein [Aphanocapsa lilacina HA4352-LM1]
MERIVSGGQTGVDRAALDVARALGIATGGWCPAGRWAEDGVIPESYPLVPTPLSDLAQRTAWNVRDADGTLILTVGEPTGGTALTVRVACELAKPHLVVDLAGTLDFEPVRSWLREQSIRILNVAGPRASTCAGIYDRAFTFLHRCLKPET